MQLQSLIYAPVPQQGPQGQQKKHTSRESSCLLNLLIICCLVVSAGLPQVAAHMDETISMQEGKVVVLPCPVNKKTCGDLHSINWFKGDHRIAVYLSDESNSTNVEEPYEDRVSVTVDPYQLIIRDLKIEDEDIYMCDTTYFIPAETCENFNGYRIELNVLVPPSEVTVLDEKGDRIEKNSIVGPLQERQTLKASCVVRNTRPQPQVGWWRGDKRLTTHSPSYDEMDGLYTATLELVHQLTRDDLANDIECRAESSAIPTAIKYRFGVDLQVRPTSITINGVEHHTVQGSKVVLTCDIHGARPPVNLTWYNNTVNISPEENELTDIRTRAFEKEDGTYHTQSELIFNATRFENDKVFRCDAENIVLQINREKPFTSSLTLEVLYPPVVKVSPPKLTVNTSDTVLLNCEYVANPASLTHVVWFRNGEMINVNDTNRYTGGNSENVALVIKSSAKNDIGNYSCQLSNVIGKGVSEEQLSLDVQYVPKVEVLMMPEGPVKEDDESNVTLYCNILDANPALLTRVRWYANSSLLKELPDCDETREDLCHVDPSKLLLESIGRGFFYNYSCEGFNAAGWGPRSKERELVVYYEPGPATLTHFPLVAIKKKSVTFSCHVEEPGYPESNRFRWLRGGRGPLQDIVTRDWTVEPVGLDSRTNYSCYAFNEGGKGGMATVNLDVHAPPFFIRNLPQYTGFYHSVPYANLTCRIECVPRCEITWLKDGTPIDKNDTRFFVKEKYMEASPATGDFESMLSVLHFNMSNWKNGRFDILKDNYNFTCMSSPNSVGPGIKSTTCVSIEYAPENTTVSEDTVYVVENTVPGRVICKSKAIPEPKFEWFFNNKSIILSNALIINTPMTRNDSGRYTCVAKNRHGVSTAETYIDVQFKPRCTLERQRLEGQDTLICTAYGNPAEASFTWSIKMENESMDWLGDADSRNHKDKSFYVLEEDYAIARTYRCVANNTVGDGPFCEIEVAVLPTKQLAWWLRWDKTTLIILVAVILILLLTVIIICCIIICVCRRRRRQEKLQEKSSTMGDLLTEPGEYENLPFHGLQTAPNKSNFTTPTDFNNDSSHVVLVAPRPKRLTNGQVHQEHKQRQKLRPEDFDIIERYDQIVNSEIQQQQQQHLRLTTQNPKTTTTSASAKNLQGVFNDRMMEIGLPVSSTSNTMPTKIVEVSSADCEIDRRVMNTQRVATNSNNCCSKSYTEYYQQQQQQQQNQQKHNANISGLPTYAVIDQYHQERVGVTAAASTNPFLAISNFKKFDTEDNKAKSVLSFLARQDTSDSKFYTLKLPGKNKNHTNSQYKSSFGIFRFNTSASSNGSGKNIAATTHSADKHERERECDFMPNSSAEKPSLKCKRHHSFAGGGVGDVDAVGRLTLQRNMALGYGGNYAATSLRRNASGELNCLEQYDTELLPPQLKAKDSSVGLPFYENLNECTADTSSSHHSPIHYNNQHNHNQNQNHTQNMTTTAAKSRHLQIMSHFEPTSSTIGAILHGQSNRKGLRKQKQRRQRRHQQRDDLNLGVIEAERLSIYRSDSGISNSSYECVTPIPGMLGMSRAHIGSTPPPHKVNKVPKQGKSGKIPKAATHKIEAPFHVASVLSQKRAPRQQEELDKRDVSPVPTLINSSYESASSSQIDGNMGCGSNSTATDPLSISSGNDSNMALNRSRNCLRHQRPSDLKTLEDFEQYRLGHNYGHSVSFVDQINCQNIRDISPSNKSSIMKTANNPFLATIQNKTSTTSNIGSRHNNTTTTTTTININTNNNNNTNSINDKGNKKLRRQTISDPHAYIRYIHSLLGDKCISKSSESTLAKSTTTTTATTTANNDKSQKQCQQQQQLQQIGLQFQGIALYDDDVAKSQNNNTTTYSNSSFINNEPGNNKWKIDNRNNDYDKRKALENQQNVLRIKQQQQLYKHQQTELSLKEKRVEEEPSKLTEQIRFYNNNNNNNNNANKCRWMGTYPTTRAKKIPISNMSTVTYTTTTNVTRMTPKIAPTTTTTTVPAAETTTKLLDLNEENCEERPIKSALRKHHSFNMQPTYIMHKQMYLQKKLEQPQSVATMVAKTPERDVNEIEQQLMTSRYQATFGGPLVFRPLTLNEKHNFKPIQAASSAAAQKETGEVDVEEEEGNSSILSEQVDEFKEEIHINSTSPSTSPTSSSTSSTSSSATITPTLHPAASLEVLEALTQSNPELIYAAIQPGSRLNLHTQLSALNETHYGIHTNMSAGQTQLRAKLHATLSETDNIVDSVQKYETALRSGNTGSQLTTTTAHDDDDDDADFCFYETDEIETDTQSAESSPNATILLNDGQVQYLIKQNLHEMHI